MYKNYTIFRFNGRRKWSKENNVTYYYPDVRDTFDVKLNFTLPYAKTLPVKVHLKKVFIRNEKRFYI